MPVKSLTLQELGVYNGIHLVCPPPIPPFLQSVCVCLCDRSLACLYVLGSMRVLTLSREPVLINEGGVQSCVRKGEAVMSFCLHTHLFCSPQHYPPLHPLLSSALARCGPPAIAPPLPPLLLLLLLLLLTTPLCATVSPCLRSSPTLHVLFLL